jgi:hypothetical protein
MLNTNIINKTFFIFNEWDILIRRNIMKAFKILLIMLLFISLILSFGCQSMQSEEMGKTNRVDQNDWRPTGTGFYVPVYKP